jgi:iron complex transport system substrate-binding protein
MSTVSAVVNKRVHVNYGPLFTISTLGYAYMAKWLNPDLFEDFDPQVLHQEYIDKFLKIDYDLNERGVFVYP